MVSNYVDVNSQAFDRWVSEGWEWGQPISHELYEKAKRGEWFVLLTPTKAVPKDWFCDFSGAKVLGLASGGGQQIPIFTALGADCTVLDYSAAQLASENLVAQREGYSVNLVNADMTQPLPFKSDSFDMIFHPVSNCYVKDVLPIWRECYRILKKGGVLLSGLDNGIAYAFNDEETALKYPLPFDPLADKALYDESIKYDWGIQFSHTIEEQIGGQLKAGFTLVDIYQDTTGAGHLHDFKLPAYYATLSVKK
ncbi:MAG: class I SAM-dependent methyltransferase [Oscillospiraceae bacterium]